MSQTQTRTFRVDREKWEKFRSVAASENKSITEALVELMELAIALNSVNAIVSAFVYIGKKKDDRSELRELEEKITNLEKQLESETKAKITTKTNTVLNRLQPQVMSGEQQLNATFYKNVNAQIFNLQNQLIQITQEMQQLKTEILNLKYPSENKNN